MRGILSGELGANRWPATSSRTSPTCASIARCAVWNVPAGVDIPKLMIEAKAAYVAINGLRLGDWFLTRLDLFSALGCLVSPFANWAFGNRQARWIWKRRSGIAQRRKLPRFASRSFHAAGQPPPSSPALPPQRAQGAVLRRHLCQLPRSAAGRSAGGRAGAQRRRRLRSPRPDPVGHGAWSRCGAVDRRGRSPRHNVRILAEAVRQGYYDRGHANHPPCSA